MKSTERDLSDYMKANAEKQWERNARLRAMSVDYSVRSAVLIRDDDSERVLFQVLCYGVSHKELVAVALDEKTGQYARGGVHVAKRLYHRGVRRGRIGMKEHDTRAVKDDYKDYRGRLPEAKGFAKPVIFEGDESP